MVDFAGVPRQLGINVFPVNGWEVYDRGESRRRLRLNTERIEAEWNI